MATELAKAYVQIVPSAQGIKGKISEELGGEASSAGKSAGTSIASSIKKAIAAAGIGAALKTALEEGGNLQQSIGGIETLFGSRGAKTVEEYAELVGQSVDYVAAEFEMLQEAQANAMNNASIAYKTAGLSANEYMETISGFAASLKQSTASELEAAEIGNQAVIDMADNANKMGTSMEAIQNAYQGFAKQNYTMLDNLKLGYGGTKTEMQRLLADAQKLTGVKYDIDNLSDVYLAIHAIQENLGITGTTAKEAASTLSGSMSSMKAAFTNVLGNLSLGEDIRPAMDALISTTGIFLFDNLFPMVGNIVDSLVDYIVDMAVNTDWASVIMQVLTIIRDALSTGVAAYFGADTTMINNMFGFIIDGVPFVTQTIQDGFRVLWDVCNKIWQSVGQPIFDTLIAVFRYVADNWDAISSGIQEVFSILWDAINTIWTEIGQPVFEAVNNILGIIRDAFAERMPAIQEFVGTCFRDIGVFWEDNLKPCLEAIGDFIENILAPAFEAVFNGFVGPLIDTVFGHIKNLWEHTLKPVFSGITDFLTGVFTLNFEQAWEGIKSILKGVFNSIITGIETFINGCISALNGLIEGINFLVGKAGDLLGFDISIPMIDLVTIPKLAKGGVLEKGQIGLLEGSGAEAVVPLDQNQKWISEVARDINTITGDNELLLKILNVLLELREMMPDELSEAISKLKFEVRNREIARLIKEVAG